MESITLYQLSEQLQFAIKDTFDDLVWVRAEISEIHENRAGHCYLELVEKDATANRILAKIKATIWSFTYKMLKPYFEQSVGHSLSSGMKILIAASVEYHEVYGLSLNIKDIDPTYSLGDIAQRRMQIISRLVSEGVFDMNRELELPIVPQCIAVVSSPTAAGYEDFVNQLQNNKNAYKFYHKLFAATMQGDRTEESVVAAFESIYQHIDCFDVVVIIRGGGAKTDLSAFDSYNLAYYCTQFPLPVLVGIGHQRDESILDLVAHTSLKTPTAVAEFLIDSASEVDTLLNEARERIFASAGSILSLKQQEIAELFKAISRLQQQYISHESSKINMLSYQLNMLTRRFISTEQQQLKQLSVVLKRITNNYLTSQKKKLFAIEKNIALQSPDFILKKGYSITTFNGKTVKNSNVLKKGDVIKTRLASGAVSSEVI